MAILYAFGYHRAPRAVDAAQGKPAFPGTGKEEDRDGGAGRHV